MFRGRGTDADHNPMNNMFVVHAAHGGPHIGAHECSPTQQNTADPDDTDEPVLCMLICSTLCLLGPEKLVDSSADLRFLS